MSHARPHSLGSVIVPRAGAGSMHAVSVIINITAEGLLCVAIDGAAAAVLMGLKQLRD
jgi:hypothetical protein